MRAAVPRYDRPLVMVFSAKTYRAPAFLEAASRLGVEIIVASDAGDAPAKLLGPRFVQVDLSDPEGGARRLVDAVIERNPLGVLALDDAAVRLAAIASGRLGTSANSISGMLATRDKAALRRRMAEAKLPQPRFLVAASPRDPLLQRTPETVGFPCVVKPVELSASTGVIRANSLGELERAAREAHEIQSELTGRDEPLLVEEYLPGREVAVEAVAVGGDLEVLALIDKPDPPRGPYFPERILVAPAELSEAEATEVFELASRAAAALGIVEGPVHAEVRWGDGGPRLLEIAARTIGGLCSKALVFDSDDKESLEEVVLRRALGDIREARCESGYSGVDMLYPERAGYLEATEGVTDAAAIPGVWGVEVTVHVGTHVEPLPKGNRYLGFVFARADDRGQCISALREAESTIRFVVEREPDPAIAGVAQ